MDVECGPSQQKLDVHGQFSGKLTNLFQSTQQKIYVIRGLHKALLGRLAIEALQMVQKVCLLQINSITRGLADCKTTTKYSCLVRQNSLL